MPVFIAALKVPEAVAGLEQFCKYFFVELNIYQIVSFTMKIPLAKKAQSK